MPRPKPRLRRLIVAITFAGMAIGLVWSFGALTRLPATTALAACSPTPPATDNGVVTQTVKLTSEGSFRLWSRIKAADTASDSYGFQVDDGCVYTVGDAGLPANAWTWVDYQDATTGSKIEMTLPAGQHTFKYYGREAGVMLDKIMLLADKGCVPTGTGDNCGQIDDTPPTVKVMSPQSGAVLQGIVTIKADAADANGVVKVEFLVNGVVRGTDTSAPYELTFDTRTLPTGEYALTAKAYDASDNAATSQPINLMIQNPELIPSAGNLLNGKVFTSSAPDNTIEAGNLVKYATDGNEFTRWISEPVDGATLTADLGSAKTLGKVSVLWAADTVKDYAIQVSSDNSSWKTVAEGTTNNSPRQLVETTAFTQPVVGRYLRLVAKNRWNDKFGNSIWEVGAYVSANPTRETSPDGGLYLSDIIPTSASNGWGPYERDMSNGNNALLDGKGLSVARKAYAKGLGIHAPSALVYDIGGAYKAFKAVVGLDDETGTDDSAQGAVGFEVWGDGKRLYDSPVIRHSTSGLTVSVDVSGVKELKLVVNDGGDGNGNDHADWADARLLPSGSLPTPTPAATPGMTPTTTPSGSTPTSSPTATPSARRGDINGDGKVNVMDLSRLLSKFGQNDGPADLNGDGRVTIIDLSILLSQWGG